MKIVETKKYKFYEREDLFYASNGLEAIIANHVSQRGRNELEYAYTKLQPNVRKIHQLIFMPYVIDKIVFNEGFNKRFTSDPSTETLSKMFSEQATGQNPVIPDIYESPVYYGTPINEVEYAISMFEARVEGLTDSTKDILLLSVPTLKGEKGKAKRKLLEEIKFDEQDFLDFSDEETLNGIVKQTSIERGFAQNMEGIDHFLKVLINKETSKMIVITNADAKYIRPFLIMWQMMVLQRDKLIPFVAEVFEFVLKEAAKSYDYINIFDTVVLYLESFLNDVEEPSKEEIMKQEIDNLEVIKNIRIREESRKVDLIKNAFNEYSDKLRDTLKRLNEANKNLFAIKSEDHPESLLDMIGFLLNSKKVIHFEIAGTVLMIYLEGYLNQYEQDMAENFHKNFLKRYDDITKDLFKKVFVDAEVKIRIHGIVTIDLSDGNLYYGERSTGSSNTFLQLTKEIREKNKRDHFVNPHLELYTCFGDSELQTKTELQNGNYIGAVSSLIATHSNLNFADSVVSDDFMKMITGRYSSKKIFENEDGSIFSYNDFVRSYSENEEENEE